MLCRKRQYEMDMCSGSLAGKLLLFALPLLASTILQLLFNAADVIVVGRYAAQPAQALAAVGSNNALINLTINLFTGISIGANVVVAQDLGAGSSRIFRKVILPLSLPGVLSGITMVFVPAVSTFAISRLLGGNNLMLLGNLIEMQFVGTAYNPHLGSAISLVMMVVVVICMAVMNRFGEGEEQAVIL